MRPTDIYKQSLAKRCEVKIFKNLFELDVRGYIEKTHSICKPLGAPRVFAHELELSFASIVG